MLRKSITTLTLFCFLISLVIISAACGTQTTSTTNGSASPTPAAPAGSPQGKGLLADIKKRGYITIATSGNNAPTIFPNEKNELVGIDADWAKIIADHLGVKIEWKRLDFKGIIPGLLAGTFDIGMSGIGVTEERLKTLSFAEHYSYDEVIAVYPASVSGMNGPEDIKGKIVGVVAGSSNGEEPARKLGGFKEIKLYPGLAEAMNDLKNGRTEAVVTGKSLAGHWIQTEGKGFKMTEKGVEGRKVSVALKQGESDLKAAIDEAITAAKKQGKYDEIAIKWLGAKFSQ